MRERIRALCAISAAGIASKRSHQPTGAGYLRALSRPANIKGLPERLPERSVSCSEGLGFPYSSQSMAGGCSLTRGVPAPHAVSTMHDP